MADAKRQKRRAKKLAKHRKKRSQASRAGADLSPAIERTDGREGRTWSVGECFLSADWHEPGAHVHAAVSRVKGGRAVAAFFEVDLADRGIIDARTLGGISPDHVRGECGRLSEETGTSMVDVAPALVAHVVQQGLAWGRDRGHPAPPGYDKAQALLGGIDPADTPFEVELGGPDTDTDGDPPSTGPGLVASLKRRLFG